MSSAGNSPYPLTTAITRVIATRTAEKLTLHLLLGGGRCGQHFPKLDAEVHLYRGNTFQYGLHLSRKIGNVALLTLNLVVITRYLTLDSKVCCVTENRMCVTLDNLSTASSEALIPQLIYTDAKTVNITAI